MAVLELIVIGGGGQRTGTPVNGEDDGGSDNWMNPKISVNPPPW